MQSLTKTMNIEKLEPHLVGANISLRHPSPGCSVYQIKDDSGSMEMTIYDVFPGICLIYNDVHIPRCGIAVDHAVGNFIEIEHCREGRIACRDGDHYFCLTQGDISIRKGSGTGRALEFPLSHYHGLAILIDLDKIPKCLGGLLDGVDIEPAALVEKFRLDVHHHIALRQLPNIEHIFSELYTVPESVRKGYHKVKVLEILLFLSALEPLGEAQPRSHYSRKQVNLAKAVAAHLAEHLHDNLTIEDLASHFDTSPTNLKASFRGVYGISVQSYQREQKMRAAARLLLTTSMSVQEVAGEFGYANSSKFSAAFQRVMGMTPNKYRLQ